MLTTLLGKVGFDQNYDLNANGVTLENLIDALLGGPQDSNTKRPL